ENAPNHANYDESKANPFPDLPDPLTLKNGKKVTNAEMWWKQRRPEIVEDFEREVIGRIPKNVPKVTWTVTNSETTVIASHPAIIQADNGAGLTRGIIGLVNQGQPRKSDDWGALRAWAWGASRALDYLETDKAIDAKHVGIEGVSRYGKAALVTMAFDTRFALVLVGSS